MRKVLLLTMLLLPFTSAIHAQDIKGTWVLKEAVLESSSENAEPIQLSSALKESEPYRLAGIFSQIIIAADLCFADTYKGVYQHSSGELVLHLPLSPAPYKYKVEKFDANTLILKFEIVQPASGFVTCEYEQQ